jgi:O-acetyl-ADP-ribose deacetylase (regulator of RNase III)
MWQSQNAVQALDKTVNNILKLADDKQLKVIALPSISSGGYMNC